MDYKIDNDKIRLLQVKQTIDEVETLQELLNAEGHNFTFDEVLKLYANKVVIIKHVRQNVLFFLFKKISQSNPNTFIYC